VVRRDGAVVDEPGFFAYVSKTGSSYPFAPFLRRCSTLFCLIATLTHGWEEDGKECITMSKGYSEI
jgi:hypothetical protein